MDLWNDAELRLGCWLPHGKRKFWGGYVVAHCNQWGICSVARWERMNRLSSCLGWWVGSCQGMGWCSSDAAS